MEEMSLDTLRCGINKLANIDENNPANWLPSNVPPPETPTETMEFLARSWSVSAVELSKALSTTQSAPKMLDNTSFTFLGDEINVAKAMLSKDYQSESVKSESPPISPRKSDESKELFLLHQALHPDFLSNQQLLKNGLCKSIIKGKTMGRRLKDQKERKKNEIRTHNAELHAAVSVAGVAAAIAAITASSTTSVTMSAQESKAHSKPTAALASATALVASHCIEIAEELGADHHQILTAVDSAINARTNGDIMTLTAGAATALRGAAILKARLQKGYGGTGLTLSEEQSEDGRELNSRTSMNFVMQGDDLLKRTRKGDLHWKRVSFNINSALQVQQQACISADSHEVYEIVVKLKSKHIGGAFTKKKKFIVSGVYSDIPSWAGRQLEYDNDHREYFGIQTADRVIEFECRNKGEKQLWTDGIHHMLNCRVGMRIP